MHVPVCVCVCLCVCSWLRRLIQGQCSAQVQLKEKKGNKWAKWQKRFASLTGTRLSISKDASVSVHTDLPDTFTCYRFAACMQSSQLDSFRAMSSSVKSKLHKTKQKN